MFEWWAQPLADLAPACRERLLDTTFEKKSSVAFATLCVLLLCGTALYYSDAVWPWFWLVAELAITGTRFRLMHACEAAHREGRRGPVDRLMAASGLWALVWGLGCAACVASGVTALAVQAALNVAAVVAVISSRNAATPRFAAAIMVLVAAPFAIAAIASPWPGMHLTGLQAPVHVLGMLFLLRKNHLDLVRLFDAELHHARLARTDPLTALGNRTALVETLAPLCGMLSTAPRNGFVVLSLDLDGFKQVNDQHGHAAGDRLLALVAERIRRALRDVDTAYRTGGDEFVAVLPAAGIAEADTVALRLIERVAQPYHLGDGTVLKVGVSVGSAQAPDHGATVTALLDRSDRALYAAKHAGRGRHVAASAG